MIFCSLQNLTPFFKQNKKNTTFCTKKQNADVSEIYMKFIVVPSEFFIDYLIESRWNSLEGKAGNNAPLIIIFAYFAIHFVRFRYEVLCIKCFWLICFAVGKQFLAFQNRALRIVIKCLK